MPTSARDRAQRAASAARGRLTASERASNARSRVRGTQVPPPGESGPKALYFDPTAVLQLGRPESAGLANRLRDRLESGEEIPQALVMPEFTGPEAPKSFFTKAVKDPGRSVLRFLDLPKRHLDLTEARWDHLRPLLTDYTLRPSSPEGEFATRAWPSAHQFRVRKQAVAEALVAHASEYNEGVRQLQEAGLFSEALVSARDLEGNRVPELPEALIQLKQLEIEEEEQGAYNRVTVFFAGRWPNKTWAEAEKLYLEEHDNSPEAQALIARVQELNEEHQVDPKTEYALDIHAKHGFTSGAWMQDALEATVTDPLMWVPGIPGRKIKPLTAAKQAEQVGIIPSLASKLDEAASELRTLEGLTPRPPRNLRGKVVAVAPEGTAVVAEGTQRAQKAVEKALGTKIPADVAADIARSPQVQQQIHSKLVLKTRDHLLETGLASSAEMADDLIATSTRPSRSLRTRIGARIATFHPDLTPDTLEGASGLVRAATAPLRAYQRWLRGQERYAASTTGLLNRYSAQRKVYEETLQQADALRLRAVEDLLDLGADSKAIEKLTTATSGKLLREVNESLVDLALNNRGERKVFKHLTGYSPQTLGRHAMKDFFQVLDPRDMLGGTEAYQTFQRGSRVHLQWLESKFQRVQDHLGYLVGGKHHNPILNGLSKAGRIDLRQRLAMALDGTLVDELQDGSRVFQWQAMNRAGEVVQTRKAILSDTELESFDELRKLFDDISDEMTQAGVKGFERGKPIMDYFPRVYGDDVLTKRQQGFGREIPLELEDAVNPSVYLGHALPRQFADRLASETLPDVIQALRSYIPAVGRKLHLEKTYRDMLRQGKALRPLQQTYLDSWVKSLKGKQNSLDKILDGAVKSFGEQFLKIYPSARVGKYLNNRPAYKISLGVHNAMYRSLLTGMVGSGMTNFMQGINTSSRYGPFSALRGVALSVDPRMRKIARTEGGIFGGLDDLMERNLPFLEDNSWIKFHRKVDDLVMAPMRLAEHHNRGSAFWAGVSHHLGGRIGSYKDWIKLSTKEQREAILAGIDAVETTQFIYGRAGQAPIFQHALTKNLTTLMTFPGKQAAFLARQFSEDPTGIARFLATSGFLTRLLRDNYGLNTEHALGFGFIPENINFIPLASPELTMFANLVSVGLADDSQSRKKAWNDLSNNVSQLLAGALGRVVPGGTLVAGVARGDTPGPVPKLPQDQRVGVAEIERDLGSRFAQSVFKMIRELEDGQLRSRNRKLVRDDVTELEAIAHGLGLQSERTRAALAGYLNENGINRELRFQRQEIVENLGNAFAAGDNDRAQKILDSDQTLQVLLASSVVDPGAFERGLSSSIQGTQIPSDLRTIMRRPGTLATRAGQELFGEEDR